MKYVMLMSLLLFAACTSTPVPSPVVPIVCSVERGLTSAFAASIGSTLNCTHLDAIQADLLGAFGKANLCPQAVPPPASQGKKGVIGTLICPLAVDAALGLLSAKIPPTWGCATQNAGALGAALTAACSNVVPF